MLRTLKNRVVSDQQTPKWINPRRDPDFSSGDYTLSGGLWHGPLRVKTDPAPLQEPFINWLSTDAEEQMIAKASDDGST